MENKDNIISYELEDLASKANKYDTLVFEINELMNRKISLRDGLTKFREDDYVKGKVSEINYTIRDLELLLIRINYNNKPN